MDAKQTESKSARRSVITCVTGAVMMTLATSILFGGASVLSGCDSAEISEPPQSLGLEWLPAFRKHAESVPSSFVANQGALIDLGDLPAGRDYYFAVTNSGSAPIRNVHVAINADSAISISPAFFETVPPRADTDEMRVVRMSVNHGTSDIGVIIHPLLIPGVHEVGIQLTGTSGTIGAESAESWDGTLHFNALVADVSFADTLGSLDSKRVGGVILGGLINGWVPIFFKHGATEITNTGNVGVEVAYMTTDTDRQDRTKFLVPGDTLLVADRATGYIRVGQTEAVRDPVRMPIFPAGETYFLLRNPR